ncbi:MalY/PatB family protein [Clostridium oceanicum]|uniref:cysteine-S-conjugate beta-lyase n=1 Tax=Clostridium oceanicum TaxID=1543 RepID=A0ABN1JLP7_9CLOT
MKHNFDEENNRLGTYCTQWDYIQDRFNKKDLIPFSISDTDFKVPLPVYEKINEVLKHQIYGYSRWNHKDYKGSIANYYKNKFKCDVNEEGILYSPSVMYSVSLLIRLLSEKEEKVATFNPMYDAFFNVIRENKRTLVTIPLHEEKGHFYFDCDEFEKLIKSCKVFILCSPHNPTGKVFKEEELKFIIETCKKYNVKIISDEIHSDIVFDGYKHIPVLSYYSNYEGLYLVSSGSKTFNYPGLIGSYAIVQDKKTYDGFLHQTRTKDFLNSVSILGMYATMVSYNQCDYYVRDLVKYVDINMEYVKNFIQKNFDDIKFTKPEGTYLAWIDCRNTPFSSEEIQDALVNVGGVGIMKGEVYGGNKYLRLNCGCTLSKLKVGMERFKKSFDYLYNLEK